VTLLARPNVAAQGELSREASPSRQDKQRSG
jgi:hypothetical protein